MNLDIFKPNDEDGAFLAYIKREALSHININEVENLLKDKKYIQRNGYTF